MTPERMYELAAGLGVPKNRQDVAAALTFMRALAAGLREAKSRENTEDALRFAHGDTPLYSPDHRDREKDTE